MTAAESLIEMYKEIKTLLVDSWLFRTSFVEYRIYGYRVILVILAVWISYLYFWG